MQRDSASAGAGTGARGTTACPECDGQVVTDVGETVCSDCGLIVGEQRIDHGPEWRSFADEDTNLERTGAPLTEARHDRGLSTEIGRYRDGNENRLSGRKRSQLSRLRREHSRAQLASKVDRNLAHGCAEISRIESALGLGESVRDRACWLFRSAQSEDLLRGRSIEAMAGGSVFAACRCAGLGRQIETVVQVAQVDKGRVQNAYDVLNVELGLAAVCQWPADFVPQLAADLAVPDDVGHRALELAQVAEDAGIANGCKPSGVAAACLYRAAEECGWSLTQATVADAANVTPVTVRARGKALGDALAD